MASVSQSHAGKWSVLVGGCLGCVVFIWMFGIRILDAQYIAWLLESGHDSIQHFVGWEFFRNEAWHFPLGVITRYGYPVPTSIVYTDSIPLLAIIFKWLAPILPSNFQYFGGWFAVCFFLQGAFAWSLSAFVTKNNVIKTCITLLFLLSPIMLNRMIEHQALAAHWIILAGLFLYLRPYQPPVHRYWLLLNTIAVLIHAYLACMLFAIWIAFIIKQLWIEKNISIQKAFQWFFLNSMVMTLVAYGSGYFVISFASMASAGGYSMDAMNLLAPFRPTTGTMVAPGHWSRFIAPLTTVFIEQGNEGFNYFGLGVLVLFAIGFFCIRKIDKQWLPIIAVTGLLAAYAVSNTIYIGQHVLFSYSLLASFKVIADIFRASGRFFWPAYYLVMLIMFMAINQRLNKRLLLPIFCGAVMLQYADLSLKIHELHERFSKSDTLSAEAAISLPQQIDFHYRHMVFLPPVSAPHVTIRGFDHYIHYAATHHLSVNIGYFARNNNAERIRLSQQLLTDALHGNFSSDTIYVITNRHLAARLTPHLNHSFQVMRMGKHTVIMG